MAQATTAVWKSSLRFKPKGLCKIKSILHSGPMLAWWVANSRLCKPTRRSVPISDRSSNSCSGPKLAAVDRLAQGIIQRKQAG